MRITHKPTYSFLLLTIALIFVNTLIAWLLSIPLGPGGEPSIYPAVAVMILFTLYFGAYGAIAAYAGGFIGAGILRGTVPPEVAVYWALADFWQALIPLVALRMLRINLDLSTRRDLVNVILFAVIINNAFGAAWGGVTLALGHVIEWAEVTSVFTSWFASNVILTALILLPALFYLTPKVAKSRLFVKEYWN
ncbi:MAG: hypothetical protein A4E35_01325 [Methanoregula sp. PtaU1.Bin051]|nr:MAG: hypothetical protein A4E35_01325 [Methanoregula sp. PtaU1.Bin051]